MLQVVRNRHACSIRDREVPRLSAAIMIPSLNLMARTLVPVTMGCCVRWTPSANASFVRLFGLGWRGKVPYGSIASFLFRSKVRVDTVGNGSTYGAAPVGREVVHDDSRIQDRRASWTRRLDSICECLYYVIFLTMTTPFIQITPSAIPQTPTPATRGRGAKRGRKPRGTVLSSGPPSHLASPVNAAPAVGAQFTPVQWTNPTMPAVGSSTPLPVSAAVPTSASAGQSIADPSANVGASDVGLDSEDEAGPSTSIMIPPGAATSTPVANMATAVGGTTGTLKLGAGAGDEDGEGEDELLPAMADDDYSAQLSWQSESKDNLKCASYARS